MNETSILIIIIAIVVFYFLFKKINRLKFEKKSYVVKTGKWIEDFFPFLKDFPTSPENFKFIGEPIDGVAFSQDAIIFCEFKTGSARLSEKQERIKQLVQDRKVEWREIRI